MLVEKKPYSKLRNETARCMKSTGEQTTIAGRPKSQLITIMKAEEW